jgi:hypothetical protein
MLSVILLSRKVVKDDRRLADSMSSLTTYLL